MKSFLTLMSLLLISCSCSSMKQSVPLRQISAIQVRPVDSSSDPEDDGDLRVLHLDGSIDSESAAIVIGQIARANLDQKKAILIEINSPGGSVDEGLLISKAIERSAIPVSCVVDGEADSMAYYILQSCKVRMMTKRSMLMIHGPSITTRGQFGGQSDDWQNIADLLKTLENAMIEHISKRMSVSADYIRYKIRNGAEWWIGFDEAKSVGAVDLVVVGIDEAKKRANLPH